jgi:hypothetical protein
MYEKDNFGVFDALRDRCAESWCRACAHRGAGRHSDAPTVADGRGALLGLCLAVLATVLLKGRARLVTAVLATLLVLYVAVFTPLLSTGDTHSEGGSTSVLG